MATYDSPAQRARRLIDGSSGKGGSVGELAIAVAVGRKTLERQFRQEIGVTITEYRTRQRLAVAVRQLHGDTGCVEAVALQAGWNSKKGLYNALNGVARLTPIDVRQMSTSEVERLLTKLNKC
jgi:AraC family transcriptional regulator of adaptative response / DNA-3-methyladenine glycosylase II